MKNPRVLIGGLGYRHLRDHSVGILVYERLAEREWPPFVTIEDVSYNPVAVSQRLMDVRDGEGFDVAIVVASAERRTRPAGTIAAYRWDQALPDPTAIQAAVAEAVTGVIALDNSLIVVRYFGGLPATVVVLEVEPEAHEFGEDLSAVVAPSVDALCDLAARLAREPALAERMPLAPLGGVPHSPIAVH